jgi:hypothetical protein
LDDEDFDIPDIFVDPITSPPRTMATSSGGAQNSHGGSQGIHLLPEYDGSRWKGAYKEWKRQVLAYQFGYDVDPKLLAPRI